MAHKKIARSSVPRAVRGRSKLDGAATTSGVSTLRKSGIQAMGDLTWGSHICLFYETKNDLLEVNTAYIQAGLDSNEFCIWAVSAPTSVDEAKKFLRRNI